MTVASGWLSGLVRRGCATLVSSLHSPAFSGIGGREVQQKGAQVVASNLGERIAGPRILCLRPRNLIAGRKQACGWGWWWGCVGTGQKLCARVQPVASALLVAHLQRVDVNNYVKRLVLKHEPRSLAPLRAFG